MPLWPDPRALDWPRLAAPLARAEDGLARLDERLKTSPIRTGFLARADFAEARDALWLEGELVPIEDLVLHDAGMDARAPTHALTRAHEVLRLRRRLAARPGAWALSDAGLAMLRGAVDDPPAGAGESETSRPSTPVDDTHADADGPLADALAGLDAALDRAARALARGARPGLARPDGADRDDGADPLLAWRDGLSATGDLPPALAAALALDALEHSGLAGRRAALAPTLASAVLRARGKSVDLLALGAGLRTIPRERRRAGDPAARLVALLAGFAAAAEAGLRDHARWGSARAALLRRVGKRRAGSRLAEAVESVLARPLVTAASLAETLRITPRAALDLIAELDLRETTGRGRYRAWAVL